MKIFSSAILVLALLFCSSCKPKNIRINVEASVHHGDQLPENPLLLHAFTTSIKPKDSLLSTLYGNDLAFNYALKYMDEKYPDGSILYEVTWKEQSDSQWFGANIPKKIVQVEQIQFHKNEQVLYTKYEGTPLKSVFESENDTQANIIAAQKIAMVP